MSILENATYPENQAYHDGPGVSWSKFKRFLESPLQYDYLFGPEGVGVAETPAMSFGSYVHALVLEPDLASKQFQVMPDMSLRSKSDKWGYVQWLIDIKAANQAEEDELIDMKADDLRAIALSSPIRFLSQADYDKGQRIADLLRPYFPDVRPGNVEAAFYAEIEGVQVKCKCDHVDDYGQIKDIKCAGQLDKWLSGLAYGDLLCADAWYRMVIREATGELLPPIEYVGVSTTEPFQICVRSHHERDFYIAEMRIRDGLRRFKQCQESGEWPGVDPTPEARKVDVRPYTMKLWEAGIDMDEDTLAEYLLATVE